jgi:hypothetical protein
LSKRSKFTNKINIPKQTPVYNLIIPIYSKKRERRRICIPKAPNQRKKLPPFNCAAKPKRKNREIRKPKREIECALEKEKENRRRENSGEEEGEEKDL